MAKYRKSETKKCPRCGEKLLFNAPKCPQCGLLFSRLNLVTNKAGKRAVRRREKEKVLRVTTWPEDAKRWKALLLCGFLGLYGAHNFYLGRYLKATFSLIFSTITTVFACMTVYPDFYFVFVDFFAIPAAFPLFFWVLDFINIAIGKYKIPVSIPDDIADPAATVKYQQLLAQLRANNAQENKKTKGKSKKQKLSEENENIEIAEFQVADNQQNPSKQSEKKKGN